VIKKGVIFVCEYKVNYFYFKTKTILTFFLNKKILYFLAIHQKNTIFEIIRKNNHYE